MHSATRSILVLPVNQREQAARQCFPDLTFEERKQVLTELIDSSKGFDTLVGVEFLTDLTKDYSAEIFSIINDQAEKDRADQAAHNARVQAILSQQQVESPIQPAPVKKVEMADFYLRKLESVEVGKMSLTELATYLAVETTSEFAMTPHGVEA